jgi:tetraacyldisaccharide 4'-kinase
MNMNPLTGLYGSATALRNKFFDRGVLSARRLKRPVISVGNLSVGGSGKTPFVIALGELLQARNISFDVLSRGYGRKTSGVRIVEKDGTAADFGDEPLLIARRLRVPVIVGESRYAAGQIAEQKFQSQLHILDDGFQHRSLARDFDIVLMTERDFDDDLLPWGRLREPLSSLKRADAVVLPAGLAADYPALQQKVIWRIQRELVLPTRSLTQPSTPVVFCGIARPEQFFTQARAAGIAPAAEIEFRDHHAYTRTDIDRLRAMRSKLGASGFLTTEKDAINLGKFHTDLEPLEIAVLKVTIDRTIDHPKNPSNDVLDAILARISERGAGS